MKLLILTTSDAGAGHLKSEGRADCIRWFGHRLVTGPVPTDGSPEDFFDRRRAMFLSEGLFHEEWWFATGETDIAVQVGRTWKNLPVLCANFEKIELWIDPDPNAHLLLIQLLDWLGSDETIAGRLWLKQSESPLALRRAGDWVVPAQQLTPATIAVAARAWKAFGNPTPEAWRALLLDDAIELLPGLRNTIQMLLQELPGLNGLGATANRLLQLAEAEGWWPAVTHGEVSRRVLAEADRRTSALMKRVEQWGNRLPLTFVELAETLCELGDAPRPAVTGVAERHYDLELQMDRSRLQRFLDSPVCLTDLGRRLVAGLEDWSRENSIAKWWGGTRLDNKTLWRWDSKQAYLIPPV